MRVALLGATTLSSLFDVNTIQFHGLRVRDSLWNLIIDSIARLRWLQEILRNLSR